MSKDIVPMPIESSSKKRLDAVVWVSRGPKRVMHIIGFTDPDEVVEGEIIDE